MLKVATVIEANVVCLLQIFGLIPANNLGAHDSDWEHVTVRLTPDAKHVTGVYYSAHRRGQHPLCRLAPSSH